MGTTLNFPHRQRVQTLIPTDSPQLNHLSATNRNKTTTTSNEDGEINDNIHESIEMKQLKIQLIPPQQQQQDQSHEHNFLQLRQYQQLNNNYQHPYSQQIISHQEYNSKPEPQPQRQRQLQVNNNTLTHLHLTAARMTMYSQAYSSFRESFTSDNSQSTIYLQPPQFILHSPILLYIINKLIQQFFDLTQCLGIVAIKIFRASLYLGFAFILINIGVLMFADNVQCMYEINGGVVELEKWLTMDTIVSLVIMLLLGINKWLVDKYKIRRRRWKYMQNVLHVVQCSWIGLYTIKFFVLNSLGSCQFFTYTYRQKDQPITTTQCPHMLNIYLISLIVFNYISILFLCVFVVEHLV